MIFIKALKTNWWVLLLYVLTLYALVNFFVMEYIITKEFYYKVYYEIQSLEQIKKMFHFKETYGWVSYFLNIGIVLFKLVFITLTLYAGTIFYSIKNIKFIDLFKVAILCEFIFVFYSMFRYGYIYIHGFHSLHEYIYNYPLSLLSFCKINALSEWMRYPLLILNIGELTYWFFTAYILSKVLGLKYIQGMGFFCNTYLLGLLLYISIITYFTISNSS